MPKITIKEIDNTKTGSREYSNFAVLVFGPKATDGQISSQEGWDTNNVQEFKPSIDKAALENFTKRVGLVDSTNWQFSNQIAWELINAGYTVLYKYVETAAKLNDDSTYAELDDKSAYDFRYIVNGLMHTNTAANNNISKLAKTRQDCVALCDIDAADYVIAATMEDKIAGIKKSVAKVSNADKYTAFFANSVTYANVDSVEKHSIYTNKSFPATFHYLMCAAESVNTFAEWYAVAGYTRGIIKKYSVADIAIKFGDTAVDALQPRTPQTVDIEKEIGTTKAVNLLVKIKNNFILWGNRTAEPIVVDANSSDGLKASHFLNIRQLCTTIKKQLYITCRELTFDPNSDILWINFKNKITPMLQKMRGDQGIKDYLITKRATDKKATLMAVLRIVPIEAVEDFEITLSLEDSISGELQVDENV